MGNKQNKQKKQQQIQDLQEQQRSKSAEPQKAPSSHNNSIYGVKIIPPVDPVSQMRRSQMNSMNMLNQSSMSRQAITPPPRMAQSKYGAATNSNLRLQEQFVGQTVAQQRNDLNRSYANSISERANIGKSQRNALNQNNSRLDLSMRVEQKRSVSPNKLLPPKEEVSMMLSNIRKKEIMQTRQNDYAAKKMSELKKALNVVEHFAHAINYFDVETQLSCQTNLILNLSNYDTFIQLRNESQQELQRMMQNGENQQDKFNEKQKLFERANAIIKTIDYLKKQETINSNQIDFTGLLREKEMQKNRDQSLENILKQNISQLSQNQYGDHHKQNSHPNIQLKEILAEVEPIQKEGRSQEQIQQQVPQNGSGGLTNKIKSTDQAFSNSIKSSGKDRQQSQQQIQMSVQKQQKSQSNPHGISQQNPDNQYVTLEVQQPVQYQRNKIQQNPEQQQGNQFPQEQLTVQQQQQLIFSLNSNIQNPMTSTIKGIKKESQTQNHQRTQSNRSRSESPQTGGYQQSQNTPNQGNNFFTIQPEDGQTNFQQQYGNSNSNSELPHFSQLQTNAINNRNNNFQEQNLPQFSNPVSNNTSPEIENRNQNIHHTQQQHYQGYQSEMVRPTTAPNSNNTQQNQQQQFLNNQQYQQQQQQLYQQNQQSEQKQFRKQWFNQNDPNQQMFNPLQNNQEYAEDINAYQNNPGRTQMNQNQFQGIPHSQSSVQLSNPQMMQQQQQMNENNMNLQNQNNQDHPQLTQFQQQQQTNFVPANPRSLTPNQQVNQFGQTNEQYIQNNNQMQTQQTQQQPATTRNIRKEIEMALATKQRRSSLQQSDIQTMKHSMNPNQPMKESYMTNIDGQLPYQQQSYLQPQYQQYYEEEHNPQTPQNTSQVNESYLSKNNVNVYIDKERLQKKGNDILVYRNVKLNKVKAAHTNNATQNNNNTMARKGSKIIQINKQQNNNPLKSSHASNNFNSNSNNNYLQQHLNKVASQKQMYKPLNASASQNVVQDQFHMIMNQQQQLQDQNLFNNVSAINYPPQNANDIYENSFLSNNSNILLNDQSLLENYNITKMHHCEGNHEHERFKTPKKYQNIDSHYSPNNLQFYLNKDHRSYSNNQKWVQQKLEINKTNNASQRTFWNRKPDTEIRTQTKNSQINQKLTNQAKNLESGLNDMQKSLALYKSSNDKIYKSTIEIPTVGMPASPPGSEKKPLHLRFDLKSVNDAKKQSVQINPIFLKHIQKTNEGSMSDRSHYTQIYPREFDTVKNVQLRDQNLQSIHQEVIDLGNRMQNGLKNGNNINRIKSSNNLSDNNEDQRNKVVYQTLGVPTSNNGFYQPNWVQINKTVNQQSKTQSHEQSQELDDEHTDRETRQEGNQSNFDSKQESPLKQQQFQQYQLQQQQQQQQQQFAEQQQNNAMTKFQQQRQQFYSQRDNQNQQVESDSYYLQYPNAYQGSEQKQEQNISQRVPAQPQRNNNTNNNNTNNSNNNIQYQQNIPSSSNQVTVIHKSGIDGTQLDLNQLNQSNEMDALKRELLG